MGPSHCIPAPGKDNFQFSRKLLLETISPFLGPLNRSIIELFNLTLINGNPFSVIMRWSCLLPPETCAELSTRMGYLLVAHNLVTLWKN
ncbi:hypothetical protein PoB_004873700 [Plakobranchus ocellatus]|uniref:Uncharacterized protein n=1 Tax=Plakobranchus ocellatus TaxID=259542 RepID=A0AAV4BTA5_9GAST|nr:hypothetical protein PoB_004873700 [Plakobranchus ocellatus]